MIAEENGDVSQLVYDDLHCALTEAVASEDFALMLACIGALADVGDQRAVPLIIPHLQSPDFPTAQVAAEALGRLGTTAARDALVRVTESDAHVNVLWAAELALKNDFTSSAN